MRRGESVVGQASLPFAPRSVGNGRSTTCLQRHIGASSVRVLALMRMGGIASVSTFEMEDLEPPISISISKVPREKSSRGCHWVETLYDSFSLRWRTRQRAVCFSGVAIVVGGNGPATRVVGAWSYGWLEWLVCVVALLLAWASLTFLLCMHLSLDMGSALGCGAPSSVEVAGSAAKYVSPSKAPAPKPANADTTGQAPLLETNAPPDTGDTHKTGKSPQAVEATNGNKPVEVSASLFFGLCKFDSPHRLCVALTEGFRPYFF